MSESGTEPVIPDIDVTKPAVARIYDFWLGGKDHFAADRERGGQMAELNPALPQLVRDNRAFLVAAVARAAGAGVAQFLDLGAGLPTHPAVHEAAREVNPEARVCYVDNDPVAVRHAQALLTNGGEGLTAIQADLTDREAVLGDPDLGKVLDLSRPVGIVLGAVLHFLPSAAAAAVCAGYLDQAADGSWLIVSAGHYADAGLAARLQRTARHARFYSHDEAALAAWTGGLRVVEPGICEARRWIAGTGGVPAGRGAYALVAAGVKNA